MLTCSWAHVLTIVGQPIIFLPWMVWHNCISSNGSCKIVSPWSQPFCGRPQGETLGVLDTLFWHASERTQQQPFYLSPTVCSSYKKASRHSFALHPFQTHISQHASWCISQYSSFQTLCPHPTFWDSNMESKYIPHLWLCDTDDIQDEQHVLFHCVNPLVISLRREYASLYPPRGCLLS